MCFFSDYGHLGVSRPPVILTNILQGIIVALNGTLQTYLFCFSFTSKTSIYGVVTHMSPTSQETPTHFITPQMRKGNAANRVYLQGSGFEAAFVLKSSNYWITIEWGIADHGARPFLNAPHVNLDVGSSASRTGRVYMKSLNTGRVFWGAIALRSYFSDNFQSCFKRYSERKRKTVL